MFGKSFRPRMGLSISNVINASHGTSYYGFRPRMGLSISNHKQRNTKRKVKKFPSPYGVISNSITANPNKT